MRNGEIRLVEGIGNVMFGEGGAYPVEHGNGRVSPEMARQWAEDNKKALYKAGYVAYAAYSVPRSSKHRVIFHTPGVTTESTIHEFIFTLEDILHAFSGRRVCSDTSTSEGSRLTGWLAFGLAEEKKPDFTNGLNVKEIPGLGRVVLDPRGAYPDNGMFQGGMDTGQMHEWTSKHYKAIREAGFVYYEVYSLPKSHGHVVSYQTNTGTELRIMEETHPTEKDLVELLKKGGEVIPLNLNKGRRVGFGWLEVGVNSEQPIENENPYLTALKEQEAVMENKLAKAIRFDHGYTQTFMIRIELDAIRVKIHSVNTGDYYFTDLMLLEAKAMAKYYKENI